MPLGSRFPPLTVATLPSFTSRIAMCYPHPIRCIFYVPASHFAVLPLHSAWWCRFFDALRAAEPAQWAFPCLWQ